MPSLRSPSMLAANVTHAGSALADVALACAPLSEPVVKRPSVPSPAQPASAMLARSRAVDEALVRKVICRNPQTIGFAVRTRGGALLVIPASLRRLSQQRQGIGDTPPVANATILAQSCG